MTDAQLKFFYFPAWRRCAETMGWVMARGRLQADLDAQVVGAVQLPDSHPLRMLLAEIIGKARELATQTHRAPTADDLRHACNLAASAGRTGASADLKTGETNRAVSLFRLLRDPDDLDAVMEWLNPAIAEKRALLNYLSKLASDDAIRAIAANAFGSRLYEDLPLDKLRWILKQIRPRHQVPAAASDDPF